MNLSLNRIVAFIVTLTVVTVASATTKKKLNVHLVGHSHDDPGWLKTVDQYYTGSNSTIYLASVQYIFDSVTSQLELDANRKYSFCEISFFSRWYQEQTIQKQEKVKRLVNNGQLHFLNGGWVMHDEAGAHYNSMIDQTTLGHRFLKDVLNYIPTVGWQIDPFGHSNYHATLSSDVGFDALYFGRIDYQDHNKRMNDKTMELVWKGSKSDPSANVLTGAFTSGNYGSPPGFCFDTSCGYCRDDPVIDDKLLETYNLDSKVQIFIDAIIDESNHSVGDNIMIKLGSDFSWDNANTWFKSIDKLIDVINRNDDRFNLFYSDPVTYTQYRAEEGVVWTTKTDDFFPYSDCEHCFWAGYFSSRPTLKYLERISASMLQNLKQISAITVNKYSDLWTEADKVIFELTAGVGLINHHDSVTGTSKQHVAEDYKRILCKAMDAAETFIGKCLSTMLFTSNTVASAGVGITGNSYDGIAMSTCRLLSNETSCAVTESLITGYRVMVVVYNPLSRVRTSQATVVLSSSTVLASKVRVFDVSNKAYVPSDLLINQDVTTCSLIFKCVDVAALATRQYVVEISAATTTAITATDRNTYANVIERVPIKASSVLTISNDLVSVTIDSVTGLMTSISRLDDPSITADVTNKLQYYRSYGLPDISVPVPPVDRRDPHLQNIKPGVASVGSVSSQASGAYIFRSMTEKEVPIDCHSDESVDDVNVSISKGDHVTQVTSVFSTWSKQTITVRDEQPYVEVQWTVGPVPIDDRIGKEVINKFQSSLLTGGVGNNIFYTDSNGREYLPRRFNYRPTWDLEVYEPIAGNYYPVTTGIYVKDQEKNIQLSVLTDRAQAGASLSDGEIELIVHRRLLYDDARGVTEPLNETTGGMTGYPTWTRSGDGITVTGTHYVLLSSIDQGMNEVRTTMDSIYHPMMSYYVQSDEAIASRMPKEVSGTHSEAVAAAAAAVSPLSFDLPVNVKLLSLEPLPNNEMLVRLSHQFAVDEDAALSASVDVDLYQLLSTFAISSITEVTLSANQKKQVQEAKKVQWATTDSSGNTPPPPTRSTESIKSVDGVSYIVTLSAMQIRTFILKTNQ